MLLAEGDLKKEQMTKNFINNECIVKYANIKPLDKKKNKPSQKKANNPPPSDFLSQFKIPNKGAKDVQLNHQE